MPARFPVRPLLMLAWAMPPRAVLAWTTVAWALTIQQAAGQALPPAVVACMNEQDPTQRLACYDREVPHAVAATARSHVPASLASAPASGTTSEMGSAPAAGSTSAGRASAPALADASATRAPSAPSAAPAPSATDVDAFGMTAQIQRKENGGTPPPRLDKLTAPIAAVSQKPGGEFVVTLDNGQVWEEAEATSHLPLRTGDDITIKRGMLGAFYMSSSQVLGLRVKRVR